MTPTEVIEVIIAMLYEERAADWSIQDKAVLLAAVNLQLQETGREQDNDPS